MIHVMESVLFPSSLLSGSILALFFTTITLLILWKVYEENYTFTTKEKAITFILSFLFMIVGTVIPTNLIPMVVWALLAFHFMTDKKYMDLPDGVNFFIAIFSVFSIVAHWNEQGFFQSGILTGVILFVLFLLFAFLGPMGGGDIKMMGAIGLYFGLWDIPSILLYGFLIGSIQGVGIMVIKKEGKDTVFPFGPALILGVLTVVILQGGMLNV